MSEQKSVATEPEAVDLNRHMWSEHFTGKELKSRWPRGCNVTIADVSEGSVYNEEDDEHIAKILVQFEEVDRPMVMNKTNLRFLAEQFGKDTNLWKGQSISIMAVKMSNEKLGIQMDKPFDEAKSGE